jgi:hypothetical protein
MGNGWCRDFARKDDVVMTDDVFNKILTRIRSGEHHPIHAPQSMASAAASTVTATGTGIVGLPVPSRR